MSGALEAGQAGEGVTLTLPPPTQMFGSHVFEVGPCPTHSDRLVAKSQLINSITVNICVICTMQGTADKIKININSIKYNSTSS